MSNWQSITVKFDVFEPIKAPVQSALQVLEAIEAVLEAILAILKAFLLDLSNPLKAIVALLLAAIRALINQIQSTGFSFLLVYPDFSQPDFGGVLHSVSGAYPRFESKVVGKFYDTADAFRPQYPPGSSVAMLVLYIGADSPGDLFGLLFSLLSLIKSPIVLSGLPSPVGLKALPVNKSGAAISQFRQMFDSTLQQAIQLEWRMPQSAAGMSALGFAGQVVSFYNQFRFPNFIIERTGPFPQDEGTELSPRGEIIYVQVSSQTLGKNVVDGIITKYDAPSVNSLAVLREEDGSVYRHFPTRIPIQFGSDGTAQAGKTSGSSASALAQTTSLITGIATGTYKYLDSDPQLITGKTYYYRVRAFFGNCIDYANATAGGLKTSGNRLVVTDGNQKKLKVSPKCTLGKPSPVVKGFVPRVHSGTIAFNIYNDVFRAIQAGLLLNFELPVSFPPGSGVQNTVFRNEQRTGWGTLGMIGGQVGPLKAAYPTSDQLRSSILFKSTARRLANSSITPLFNSPSLVNILAQSWTSNGIENIVDRLIPDDTHDLASQEPWSFIAVVGGITQAVAVQINDYLAKEEVYTSGTPLAGPAPITSVENATVITIEERQALAEFLHTALSTVSTETSYLSWYSVTVGDLFPILLPFIFDFEQFLKSLLKSLESALKEITDIVETLLQKIKALAQILQTLDEIIATLEVNVTVSVLAVSSTNGSADSLVQELMSSTDKPGQSPFGFHSGMVMTFGGPGQGSVAAFNALKFILSLPS